MKKRTTNQLVADVLAIHLEVQRRVQDKRHRITPLQVNVLADAITSINRFLIAWQTQYASKKKVVGL